ncbi:MAG: GatB/YqeY domain-containing protein [Tepidisphaerales bacterium]
MSQLINLQNDMKACMKAGNKDRLGVIRMLINEVKTIDLQPNKPTEEQAIAAYAKKLRKSIEEMEKYAKTDDAAKIKAELAIVEEFMPKKLGPAETEKLVADFLAANSFTEKQLGQAMGMFMKQHGQLVEAAAVNALLKQKLAGK